jgi:hypothetical protein
MAANAIGYTIASVHARLSSQKNPSPNSNEPAKGGAMCDFGSRS